MAGRRCTVAGNREGSHRQPHESSIRQFRVDLGGRDQAGLGKLDLATDVPLAEIANDEGFDPLPITHDHAAAAADLPPHHRDPVDRMLVAQAVHENLVLVSGDEQVVRYDVPVIWSG